MPDTTVYFATNRAPDPTAAGGYGSVPLHGSQPATYAVVPVTGIDMADERSGTLGVITEVTPAQFTETVAAEIEASGKNLLVFIHGFDNSFRDAITRAAYVREWFAASGVTAADTTVLAFTWPSGGELFKSLPAPPQQAYLDDQTNAGASAAPLAMFLRQALALAQPVQARGGRAFLLAHSMGNHALARGIPALFAAPGAPAAAHFDEVILAAADEVDTTLHTPADPMFQLRMLAKRISVYSSRRDVAMDLSMTVNRNARLGFGGPIDKGNAAAYPVAQFRSVDCTEVFDFFGLIPPDATHQYYRRSKTVRADIAKLMAGQPVAPGVSTLKAWPI